MSVKRLDVTIEGFHFILIASVSFLHIVILLRYFIIRSELIVSYPSDPSQLKHLLEGCFCIYELSHFLLDSPHLLIAGHFQSQVLAFMCKIFSHLEDQVGFFQLADI